MLAQQAITSSARRIGTVNKSFVESLKNLWLRFITLGILSFAFTEALMLAPGKAQGWTYYLTVPEVLFEVLVRLLAAAWIGLVLGTACALVVAPLLWWFGASRERVINTSTDFAVTIAVFLVARYALTVMIKWSYGIHSHRAIYDKALEYGLYLLFVVALCVPKAYRSIASSMDGMLTDRMTRRTAIATVAGTAAVVAAEYVMSQTLPARQIYAAQAGPKGNFLLITFDALSAEDMSLYGRNVPTTPNIDAFARRSTVFTNLYSASTFTTPAVSSIMTGTYPSETGIFQLQSRLRYSDTLRSLPHAMRTAGYHTGAFLSNPFAYYVIHGMRGEFDTFPEPTFQHGGLQHLWHATTPLHQDSGVGSRIDEYFDLEHFWNYWGRLPDNLSMRYRPAAAFQQAKQLLSSAPDGYFVWIHLITPHNPYLPGPEDRGRFLAADKVTTYEEEFGNRWKPHYPPSQQPLVDERRLRYDEFIATGDRALGSFLAEMEGSGKLDNTTVVISADHGESFSGGIYEHSTIHLTRPVIHIPLIVRTPGQQDGRTVSVVADQTSVAPTLLELAGVTKPDSMRSPSLLSYLNGTSSGDSAGRAYCQYFERNNSFKPITHGSVGVIEGEFQYVVYIDNQVGALRPLREAEVWNLDHSPVYPQQAAALREVLRQRFPDLIKNS